MGERRALELPAPPPKLVIGVAFTAAFTNQSVFIASEQHTFTRPVPLVYAAPCAEWRSLPTVALMRYPVRGVSLVERSPVE